MENSMGCYRICVRWYLRSIFISNTKVMWIYNWCWWEWGIKFWKIVRHNIPLLPHFKQELASNLWHWIEIGVCKPHDYDFYRWGLLIAYLWANAKFTYRFTIKFWWTNLFLQLLMLPVVFIWMNIAWVKYFHWCLPWNKRDTNILL